ncbi:MAG: sigma-70 family RNA polymerase sigma factor [Chitinophagaceae bacterium]
MNTSGQPDLFLDVIQANKGIIYKVANAYCFHAEDRKDLVQEIIIQLWKSFHNYTDAYKYSTWMYRIALNTAISFYRKESRRQHVSNPLHAEILHLEDTSGIDETTQNIKFLQQFIGELKELDKAVMLLYMEEKSLKEIAAITGISATNTATKIARIKKILKQKFDNIKN